MQFMTEKQKSIADIMKLEKELAVFAIKNLTEQRLKGVVDLKVHWLTVYLENFTTAHLERIERESKELFSAVQFTETLNTL